jgi:acyl-CoA thioesterase I
MALIQAAGAEDNIVYNNAFGQKTPGGDPAGWIYYFPPVPASDNSQLVRGAKSLFSLDAARPGQAGNSLKISSSVPVRCCVSQQNVPCVSGQTLRIGVWMKGRGLDANTHHGACARMSFISSNSATQQKLSAANTYLWSPGGNFDWTHLEANVPVPPDVRSARIELFLWQSAGTVWFDNVSLSVISGPQNAGAMADPDALGKYRSSDASLPEPDPAHPRVIFVGDSITERWNLGQSFPEQGYINRGVSGQQTSQIEDRLPQDVLALHPSVVWLLAGTNDLAAGLSEEDIVANLRQMVLACRSCGIRIIVSSLLPVSDYHASQNPDFQRTLARPPAQILAINKAIESMCRQEKATFLDLHAILADASGFMPADLSPDGVHPNAAGYAKIAPAVQNAIDKALADGPQK